MNRKFFEFCHLLIKCDRLLLEIDEDQAYTVCKEAFGECEESELDSKHWILINYKQWINNFIYVSEHMPEQVREILIKK
jgi:hypothetical protein